MMGMTQASPALDTSIGCALVVSDDSTSIEQLAACFHQLAIATEVCADSTIAFRLLNRQKFEAVVIDLKLTEQTDTLLEQVRLSPSNRTAVTFAVKDRALRNAAEPKATFVLERPLSMDLVNRILQAAYGMIVRERRRYFRCPVTIPAAISRTNKTGEIPCDAVNISEGGLAVNASVPLKPGEQVNVQFTLPGQLVPFKTTAEICWYNEKGRSGLQFLSLASHEQIELQYWISRRLEESLPESVARRFRKASGLSC
jgi:CheY-like chemotaxis protein